MSNISSQAGHARSDATPETPGAEQKAGFVELFVAFLIAGGLIPGGGYAVVAPLRRSLVEKYRWLSPDDFDRQQTIANAMPGVFNLNLAALLGRTIGGWGGCVAALLGMALPALLVFVVFATFWNEFRHFAPIQGFLRGVRPALVALILLPCFDMWRKSSVSLSTVWIPVGAAIAIGLLGVSPSYIILGFTLLGILYGVFVHTNP